ncbi:MAG: hypothetical protein GY851_09890, partial [bacterium]|nr:hypothetical protein [bacterium]
YHAVKKAFRRKKKREHTLIGLGVVLILLSFPVSTYFVRHAERERAPDIEDYKRTGIVTGATGIITAKGERERQFAQNTYDVWETYRPGTVTGVEVTRLVVGVYVNSKVRSLSDEDLEMLTVATVKAHHRQLRSKACTLLVVEGTTTIVEAEYNVLSGEPHVKFYD